MSQAEKVDDKSDCVIDLRITPIQSTKPAQFHVQIINGGWSRKTHTEGDKMDQWAGR